MVKEAGKTAGSLLIKGLDSRRERAIGSFSEFTDFLANDSALGLSLYRGQPLDAPLLPKIARLGLGDDILTVEQRMFETFKEHAILYVLSRPTNEWEWLALAQHHRLPTRLLDWTTNPLAALWFAITSKAPRRGASVVWVFRPDDNDMANLDEHSPFDETRTKVFRPAHVSPRIRAQSGYFTVHKRTRDRFIAFEKNTMYKDRLTKLAINPEVFTDLTRTLNRFGINSATLFPDLDGVCAQIEAEYTVLR